MRKFTRLSVSLCTTLSLGLTLGTAANAADNMAGMKMDHAATTSDASILTDAVVKSVDTEKGMITLQHGAMKNVNMAAMTMAYKARDAAMVTQAKAGEKVKVRVENVSGTFTIVRLIKQ